MLNDAEVRAYLGLVFELRGLADALTEEVLLPQLPDGLQVPSMPDVEGGLETAEQQEAFGRWQAAVGRVRAWAAEQLGQVAPRGMTEMQVGGDTTVSLGSLRDPSRIDAPILRVPVRRMKPIVECYVRLTGETPQTGALCLRMLNNLGHAVLRGLPGEAEVAAGMAPDARIAMGWAMRCIEWSLVD